MNISYSIFQSVKHIYPESVSVPWTVFSREMSTHQYTSLEKHELPCFSPATFREGTRRHAGHVESLAFGVLDLDKVPEKDFQYTLDKLSCYDSFAYTTWSHTNNGLYSARACVRFREPATPEQWIASCDRFNDTFRNVSDRRARDISRVYYLPYLPHGAQETARTWSFFGPGYVL